MTPAWSVRAELITALCELRDEVNREIDRAQISEPPEQQMTQAFKRVREMQEQK